MAKITRTCPTCLGRKKLWLGGKDFVECPDCDNGIQTMYEDRVRKTERLIFIPGLPVARTLTNKLVKVTT